MAEALLLHRVPALFAGVAPREGIDASALTQWVSSLQVME